MHCGVLFNMLNLVHVWIIFFTQDMAQEERDRVKNDLEAKEKELKKAQDEQAQLSTKLQVGVVYHYSASYCMISVYMEQQS